MRIVHFVSISLLALFVGGAPAIPALANDGTPASVGRWWTAKQRAGLLKAGAAMRKRVDPVVALDTYGLEALIDVSDNWPADWPVWAQIREAKAITGWDETKTLLDLTRKISETTGAATRSAFVMPLIELIERGDTSSTLPAHTEAQTSGEVEAARVAERTLAAAIDLYYLEYHDLPTTLAHLALPSKRTNVPLIVHVPRDPWGEHYEYRILRSGTSEFLLTSRGPDRQLGTKDDVVFPDPDAK